MAREAQSVLPTHHARKRTLSPGCTVVRSVRKISLAATREAMGFCMRYRSSMSTIEGLDFVCAASSNSSMMGGSMTILREKLGPPLMTSDLNLLLPQACLVNHKPRLGRRHFRLLYCIRSCNSKSFVERLQARQHTQRSRSGSISPIHARLILVPPAPPTPPPR